MCTGYHGPVSKCGLGLYASYMNKREYISTCVFTCAVFVQISCIVCLCTRVHR